MEWTPGRNKARRALEDPYEGVPEHLQGHLWSWVERGLRHSWGELNAQRIAQLAIHVRLPASTQPNAAIQIFTQAWNEDKTVLLDLTESMLELHGSDDGRAYDLDDLLESVNSAYAVNDELNGLEVRIADGVKPAVQASVDLAGGSAGDHLTAAWNEAYGRTADPVKAYSEAIKATEAALAGTISPTNTRATLGTMIRDVASKPEKWQFVGNEKGVETVLAMMRGLWEGQTSRHGGVSPTRAETLEEARAAVHLAATLVQFGASGAFGGR
jgi:hypothetical protein